MGVRPGIPAGHANGRASGLVQAELHALVRGLPKVHPERIVRRVLRHTLAGAKGTTGLVPQMPRVCTHKFSLIRENFPCEGKSHTNGPQMHPQMEPQPNQGDSGDLNRAFEGLRPSSLNKRAKESTVVGAIVGAMVGAVFVGALGICGTRKPSASGTLAPAKIRKDVQWVQPGVRVVFASVRVAQTLHPGLARGKKAPPEVCDRRKGTFSDVPVLAK